MVCINKASRGSLQALQGLWNYVEGQFTPWTVITMYAFCHVLVSVRTIQHYMKGDSQCLESRKKENSFKCKSSYPINKLFLRVTPVIVIESARLYKQSSEITCEYKRRFFSNFNPSLKHSLHNKICVHLSFYCYSMALTFPSLSIGMFILISFLYAILSGHFLPNPNGGSMFLNMLKISV